MLLRIKFAQIVRKVLTPFRKYMITRRIKKRLDKSLVIYKKELVFIHKKVGNHRPFGVMLALKVGDRCFGAQLRCGCYYLSTRQLLNGGRVMDIHRTITQHGEMLPEYPITRATPEQESMFQRAAATAFSGVYMPPINVKITRKTTIGRGIRGGKK